MQAISSVICVCSHKDSLVWATSSRHIANTIGSNAYEVIVPDHEVDFFRMISASPFKVTPESAYLNGITLNSLKPLFPEGKKSRAGWYLQQIIKISAAMRGDDDDVVLIWDADTVPLKNLNFVSDDGSLVYYKSHEYYAPYFLNIKRLIGLDRIVDFSFVSQCFPARVGWVRSFIGMVEKINNYDWVSSILNSVDFTEGSGFSGYEALGTFFSHNFSDKMKVNNGAWERFGNSKVGFGCLNQGKIDELARAYEYISFESWDPDRAGDIKQGRSIIDIRHAGDQDNLREVFTKIYETSAWGKSDDQSQKFYSGGGTHNSSVVLTYVDAISEFVTNFNLNYDSLPNVVDLGCGDFFIGSKIRKLCNEYVACDIVDSLIEFNSIKYVDLGVDFRVLDFTEDALPDGDVVFVRQVFQHLSNDKISQAISKMVGKYKYLVVTEHIPTNGNFIPNIDKPSDSQIRLNIGSGVVLTSSPFNLKVKEDICLCEVADFGGLIRTNLYKL